MLYALIAAIESEFNDTNVNTGICESCKRRLESEAIECFSKWRENGGWLKDIPIYAVCPTKNVISEDTKEKFNELNVTYIEEYKSVTETFTSGFLNIPLIGMMMEERLKEDFFIKIDLDMNLIKPLPKSMFENDITLGQYDDYCTKMQRGGLDGSNPMDTGFLISKRKSGIYKHWFDIVMHIMGSDDPEWLKVKAQTGEYFLEEFCMDKIVSSNKFDIKLIQKYQIGEWYTPVKEYTNEELENVYFWHEHIEYDKQGYDKIREKIEYRKRINGKQ